VMADSAVIKLASIKYLMFSEKVDWKLFLLYLQLKTNRILYCVWNLKSQ
jgi:hypothetical protein